jgi:hypothetical protein
MGGMGGGVPPMGTGDDELTALLEGMDPALLEQLISLGALDGEQGMAAMDMARGDRMAQTPMPEGRNAGRTFVAANPLEFVGAAGMRMKGDRERDAAMVESHGILGKQTAGRKAFAELLAGGLRKPTTLPGLMRSDEFEEG